MTTEYKRWYLVFWSCDDDHSLCIDIYKHRDGALLPWYISKLHKVFKGETSYHVVVNELNTVIAYEKAYKLIQEFRQGETVAGVTLQEENGEERFRFSGHHPSL